MAERDNEGGNGSEDILHEGREAFDKCHDAERHNRLTALDDIRFSRLGFQWPNEIRQQREQEQRPCLTINKMPSFIRQVVNDARQNKPSIKVHPVDDGADPEVAEILNGLIRNIEYTSNADVAYDTAIEQSVSGGFGYWRVGMDYAYHDAFDMDLKIERISNQFSVYGDPSSTAADSSDWDIAFVVDRISKEQFKRKYKGKKNVDDEKVTVDFSGSGAWSNSPHWLNEDGVLIAEWWKREEVDVTLTKLSNGFVYTDEELQNPDIQVGIDAGMLTIVGTRPSKKFKVTQTIMTGADVLEVNDWPGCYIPIIPVYGDEIVVEGKRYFRSLIHNAIDAQRMLNYWRTVATETAALTPRVPWIGRKGTFNSDPNWATANTRSHAFLEFDGEAPQRMPMDMGSAAGALQEALNASDDMKAIMGIYDASLGARSNETSGKAIMARQREGDVATFHFIDNLSRAIRHTGRILIDLIPKVYSKERIVRTIGEDGTPETKKVNAPTPAVDEDGNEMQDDEGNAIMRIYDLTAGKYDLTVTSGPSFTTKREEAAVQMTEFIRSFPQAAPFIGDLLAKNLDWPGADEIAKRLAKMNPALQQQGMPPELQQTLDQMKQAIEQLQGENNTLKQDKSVEAYNAQTNRLKVAGPVALAQNPYGGPFPIPGGPQPDNGPQGGAPMPPMMPPGQ